MKRVASLYKLSFIATAMILGVVLGLLALPAGAGPIYQISTANKIGQLERKFGPAVTLNQTLFNVKVPVNISNMPGAWKNATLYGFTMVYFLNNSGDSIGGGYPAVMDDMYGMKLSGGLSNGGYNGTVVFPINRTAGVLSGKTCGYTVISAKLGSQAMIIGATSGGTAPHSGPCSKLGLPTPGTIYQMD